MPGTRQKLRLVFLPFRSKSKQCGALCNLKIWFKMDSSRRAPLLFRTIFFLATNDDERFLLMNCTLSHKEFPFTLCYGNTGCGVFKRGIQNYKDFCLRIHIPQGNYWILSLGLTASCQKVPKFDFQSQFFLCQKSSESFSIFFHWRIPI